ncbi:MAG: hypothetical protein R3300_14140, partial [Candidatus Promineifilaceae bacterium]|nr:hypothetical protein [Candidatus Promineifilaceae bacterium]
LQGGGPPDFWAHCQAVAAQMLLLAGRADDIEAAGQLANDVRQDGRALKKFRQLVRAQGGDGRVIEDDDLLPQAKLVKSVTAPRDGVIAALNARDIGWSVVRLGGGRQTKGDEIDHSVGMVIPVKVGQRLEKGDGLATIHAADEAAWERARDELLAAITWTEETVEPLPHIYETVRPTG